MTRLLHAAHQEQRDVVEKLLVQIDADFPGQLDPNAVRRMHFLALLKMVRHMFTCINIDRQNAALKFWYNTRLKHLTDDVLCGLGWAMLLQLSACLNLRRQQIIVM